MFLRKQPFRSRVVLLAIIAVLCMASSFKKAERIRDVALRIQQKLIEHYDASQESPRLKTTELIITDDGFIRFRKYLPNGKQEYFSFNVARFGSLVYLGNTEKGNLLLHTVDEDVIVQTFQDPKGDIDSMGRSLIIPLKAVEPEELIQIERDFNIIKKELN